MRLKILGSTLLVLAVGCSQQPKQNATTYVRGTDGTDQAVSYVADDGLAVMEGDIILGTVEEAEARLAAGPQAEEDSHSAIVSRLPFNKWSKRTIPYVIDEKLSRPERIEEAIKHWEAKTSIRFVKRTNQFGHVRFAEVKNGCSSPIGKVGFPQTIRLSPRCGVGAVIHEIGHSVGLWHEQSRGDRDENITIQWENITPYAIPQFTKHWIAGRDLGDYDFGSIMHYDPYAFSKNGKPTITRKDGSTNFGQRVGLSPLDVQAVEALYR